MSYGGASFCTAWQVTASQGKAVLARQDTVRRGEACHGGPVWARSGREWHGGARRSWRGEIGHGVSSFGEFGSGEAVMAL